MGETSCGRRNVWRTDLRPSAPTTRAFRLSRPITTFPLPCRRAAANESSPVVSSLAPGRERGAGRRLGFDVLPRLGHEHVVEGRLDQLQRLDGEPRVVEAAHHPRDLAGAAL